MDPAKMVPPGWNTSYFPEEIDGLIRPIKYWALEGLWGSKVLYQLIMPVSIGAM